MSRTLFVASVALLIPTADSAAQSCLPYPPTNRGVVVAPIYYRPPPIWYQPTWTWQTGPSPIRVAVPAKTTPDQKPDDEKAKQPELLPPPKAQKPEL
jgi:hypothetical protein